MKVLKNPPINHKRVFDFSTCHASWQSIGYYSIEYISTCFILKLNICSVAYKSNFTSLISNRIFRLEKLLFSICLSCCKKATISPGKTF